MMESKEYRNPIIPHGYWNTGTWNDRWIMEDIFPGKRNGYFVDLGAFHPKWSSSTYLLEKELGWLGILIDANPAWDYSERTNCVDVRKGISAKVETLDYWMMASGQPHHGYNGFPSISKHGASHWWGRMTRNNVKPPTECSQIECLPLEQVLKDNNAPKHIDYLSVDIEGAEWEAFRKFPFSEYSFGAISVESPTPNLKDLLKSEGYLQVENLFSEKENDKYYIPKP